MLRNTSIRYPFFLQVYACATLKPSSPVRMVPVYPLVGFVMVLKIAKMEVMKLLIVDLAVVSISNSPHASIYNLLHSFERNSLRIV